MNKEIKERIETINNGNVPTELIKSEIGLLPVDWATVTLNDIADALTQTAGKESYETVSISAGIGFVNQAEKFGKELSGKQYEKYIVLHKGDFSYNKGNSKKYPQGCIYRLKDRETAAVPNVFESFSIKSGYADYYEQLFTSGFLNKQLSRKINHGVRDDGLLNLTGKDFYSCALPYPPVKEQEKIAKILSRFDIIIEKCEKEVEEYKNLKKTCLSKMFPKEGSNVPEIRFPGFTDAWEQRELGELSETTYGGGTPNTSNLKYWNGDIPWIQSSDIVEHQLYGTEPKKYITQTGLSKSATKLIPANSIAIVTRVGVGKLGVMPFSYTTSQDFLSLSNLNVDVDFGAYLLYKKMQSELNAVQGTSIKGVTKEELLKKKVLVPSKAEQVQIGTYFRNLDNLITLHQRKADEYKQLKKALTQLLLTGIVRT